MQRLTLHAKQCLKFNCQTAAVPAMPAVHVPVQLGPLVQSLQELTKRAEDMGINWGLEVINRYESNVCNTGLRVSASLLPHCTLHFCMKVSASLLPHCNVHFCMSLSSADSAHELSMQTCMCIGQQELHRSCIDSKQLAHMLCHNHLFARLPSCCLIVHCCSIFTPATF